jgi:hypothetical protein
MKRFLLFTLQGMFSKSKINSKVTGKSQNQRGAFTILTKEEVESDRSSAYAYLL